MNLKLILLLLPYFVFFNSNSGMACQCPLTALSVNECDKYQIIFRGRVINHTNCSDKPGETIFQILELYKGKVHEKFKVLYHCNEPCASTFNPGEEWIIYTNYKQVDNAMLDWCSRSRRYIKNFKEDYYAQTYGNSYDEELVFLRKNLGTYRVMEDREENAAGKRNIIPSKTQLIVTLFISMAVVILFIQLFKKYFK